MIELLVLTSCIAPCKQNFLKLQNKEERLAQTVDCIKKFIDSGAFKNIIICDSSGVDLSSHDIANHAIKSNIEFESLAFMQDEKSVQSQGKGYGEGEIMSYIVKNSILFNKSDSFIKVTGRLYIDNIYEINRKLNAEKIYFNFFPSKKVGCVDTRFYAMPTLLYKKYFLEAYKQVNDCEHRSYEVCFTETLSIHDLKFYPIPIAPIFCGISGTNNMPYRKDKTYFLIKLLTNLNIMNSKFAGICLWILRAFNVLLAKIK